MLMEGEYVAHFLDIVWYFQGLSKKRFSSIKCVSIYLLFLKKLFMERVNLFYHYSSTAGFIMKTFSFFFLRFFKYINNYNMCYVFTTDSQSKNLLILNSWIRNTLKMRLEWVSVIHHCILPFYTLKSLLLINTNHTQYYYSISAKSSLVDSNNNEIMMIMMIIVRL